MIKALGELIPNMESPKELGLLEDLDQLFSLNSQIFNKYPEYPVIQAQAASSMENIRNMIEKYIISRS